VTPLAEHSVIRLAVSDRFRRAGDRGRGGARQGYKSAPAEGQVRSRLAARASRIRTLGPSRWLGPFRAGTAARGTVLARTVSQQVSGCDFVQISVSEKLQPIEPPPLQS
jgi:hypothetical protein